MEFTDYKSTRGDKAMKKEIREKQDRTRELKS